MSKVDQQMQSFVNRTYDEIEVGNCLTFPHRLTEIEADALAFVSGETDAFQVETEDSAPRELLAEAVAGEALLSALLKRRLPGPGTEIVAQNLQFSGALGVGDELAGAVTATQKHRQGNLIVLSAC